MALKELSREQLYMMKTEMILQLDRERLKLERQECKVLTMEHHLELWESADARKRDRHVKKEE